MFLIDPSPNPSQAFLNVKDKGTLPDLSPHDMLFDHNPHTHKSRETVIELGDHNIILGLPFLSYLRVNSQHRDHYSKMSPQLGQPATSFQEMKEFLHHETEVLLIS